MSIKISQKIKEIDEILANIESGAIPLEETVEKYKEAISKAEALESELNSLENEIEVLSKNFAQEQFIKEKPRTNCGVGELTK